MSAASLPTQNGQHKSLVWVVQVIIDRVEEGVYSVGRAGKFTRATPTSS